MSSADHSISQSDPWVRGRVKVQNGTVVADNGSLLRMIHSYVHDFCSPWYSDVQWWRTMRDVGHFNTVRVMAFLGSWPKSTQTMDLKTLIPRLDGMVDLAANEGLYVLIDNHSECCGDQNVANNTVFWKEVAPRYKDRTHVFYELKNEPNQYEGLTEYEQTMYEVIRPLAPQTHIILWTIEHLIHVTDPLALIRSLPGIDYTNASVGVHPYATYRKRQRLCDALGLTAFGCKPRLKQLLALIETLKSNYPTVMTELAPNAAGGPGRDFLMAMENIGVSWGFLGGQGFTDVATQRNYGPLKVRLQKNEWAARSADFSLKQIGSLLGRPTSAREGESAPPEHGRNLASLHHNRIARNHGV